MSALVRLFPPLNAIAVRWIAGVVAVLSSAIARLMLLAIDLLPTGITP